MPSFSYLLLTFGIGLFLGIALAVGQSRARGYQNSGEALVSSTLLAHFATPDYHLLNHVTLPFRDGSTQVDHILVSRFGVFVIETKDYSGWIFANPKHSEWTQVFYRSKFRFQNPIFQNQQHVRAVHNLLDFLPPDMVESVVVFVGEAEFKTEVPLGVFDLPSLINHLRGKTSEVMSLNRMQFCVGRIETVRLTISQQTDVEHIQNLERRHANVA